ncbi:15829_t:CDS:2 [Funneliformis geosporum]|nr:15829_t:CDS:2 [Funneliformis geosporum]
MVSKNKIICLFGYEKTQTVGDFCFREIGSSGFPLETQIEKYYSVGEVAKYVCAGLMLAVQIKEKYTPVNTDSIEMKSLHLDVEADFHVKVRWYTAGGEYTHVRDCYYYEIVIFMVKMWWKTVGEYAGALQNVIIFMIKVRWYTAGGEYAHVRDCYFHGKGCGGNVLCLFGDISSIK